MSLSWKVNSSIKVIKDLEKFKSLSDLIIANRMSEDLKDVEASLHKNLFYDN